MTEAGSPKGSRALKPWMVIGGILAGASLLMVWFLANIFFDRWGIGGFGPSPLLPYPSVGGSPSYNSAHWAGVFYIYLLIGIPIGVVITGELFYELWRYRARPGGAPPPDKITEGTIPTSSRGKSRTLLYTNIFVAILLFTLTIYSIPLNNTLLGPPPHSSDAITIKVYGLQWEWRFVYPDGKTVNGSAVLPTNEEVIFKVTSLDVMHDFAIPSLRVKVDAYAGHWNTAWTNISMTGNYTAYCMELCGVGHADMIANIEVVNQAQFAAWYTPPT